jgi:YD repeat-containing protein
VHTVYANGAFTSQAFDAVGNLTQIVNSTAAGPVPQLNYSYNPAYQRTSEAANDGTVTTWSYDNNYQLVNEARAGGPTGTNLNIMNTYDPAGNRTGMSAGVALTNVHLHP